jgi:hypothetical protein
MDYLNIHRSVLDSEEFLSASLTQRGAWLSVYRYCAGQENGGRIEGAKAWTDRAWLQICGVSLREIRSECRLWVWEGDALVLWFYNMQSEANTQRLRSQAAAGAHARWNRIKAVELLPAAMPLGIPAGNGSGDAKGNGMEGKERKDIPEQQPATAGGRINGSHPAPKTTRRSKPGSTLPSEHPEDLGGRMIAAGVLMRRQASTPWSADELEAFRAQRLDTCAADDFAAQLETMRGYYTAKIPREMDYRRRELKTLLNNWPGELDKARAHARDNNDGVTKV